MSGQKKKQNEIASTYLQGSDLKQREESVLQEASFKLGFVPTQLIGRSAWWGSSEIGAFHYLGTYQGKKAVLKIQGIKPNVSEIYMIKQFAKNNKSELIRPPKLYAFLPWDEKKRYEALILEFIEGEKIVQVPTTSNQVKHFFSAYKDYRLNCRSNPWIKKPEETLPERVVNNFEKWKEASFRIYPQHPLRQLDDLKLTQLAFETLKKGYQNVEPEFQHGHWSALDLYQVEDHIVVLSNLYWSWRAPFYDTVFAYHWFMYHLNTAEGITPEEVEKQRLYWLDEIYKIPQNQEEQRLLNLALLERAGAGLNLDGLSSDPNKPISAYLIEATRQQIKTLLEKLS